MTTTTRTISEDVREAYIDSTERFHRVLARLHKLHHEARQAAVNAQSSGATYYIRREKELQMDLDAERIAYQEVSRKRVDACVRLVQCAPSDATAIAHAIKSQTGEVPTWKSDFERPVVPAAPLWMRMTRHVVPPAIVAAAYAITPFALLVGIPVAWRSRKAISRHIFNWEADATLSRREQIELFDRINSLSQVLGLPLYCVTPSLVEALALFYKEPEKKPTKTKAGSYSKSDRAYSTSGHAYSDSGAPGAACDDDFHTRSSSDAWTYATPMGVNPASGLPMISGSSIDVAGNVYGSNNTWDSGGYDNGGFNSGFNSF